MNDRNPEDLIQELRDKVPAWLAECKRRAAPGDAYAIICTYRSDDDQAAAYAIGRTLPGKIITNRKPGTSAHNFKDKSGKPASKAFDFAVLRYGKYIADGDDMAYKLGGMIAEDLGLEWAGRWTGKLKEAAHVQLKGA